MRPFHFISSFHRSLTPRVPNVQAVQSLHSVQPLRSVSNVLNGLYRLNDLNGDDPRANSSRPERIPTTVPALLAYDKAAPWLPAPLWSPAELAGLPNQN